MEERIIMHVDMNAFFASVEQRCNPSLRGKPIVVGGNPNSRTVVAAASYEAKAFGIKNGMSLYEARRLCPNLIPIEGTPAKYIDTAMRIFKILTDYTPDVEIFSIDEAFMDITHFSDTPRDVAKSIKERINEEFGLTCSIGIGPNKMIAKLASGMQKPDGLVRIKKEEVSKVLEKLPVEELCGIGERLKEHLFNMGIVTCGDLGRTAVKVLTSQFGIIGEVLQKMGRGENDEPVQPYSDEPAVKSMGHSRTLDKDIYNIQVIKATILSLSEMVGRRLRQDNYQGRTVSLFLRFSDFDTVFAKQLTIGNYIDDGYDIYQAALRILKSAKLHKAVRMVGVSVSNLKKDERQIPLLEEDRRRERLLNAMDRVNDKWGEWTVTRASLLKANPATRRTPTHGFLHHQQKGIEVR